MKKIILLVCSLVLIAGCQEQINIKDTSKENTMMAGKYQILFNSEEINNCYSNEQTQWIENELVYPKTNLTCVKIMATFTNKGSDKSFDIMRFDGIMSKGVKYGGLDLLHHFINFHVDCKSDMMMALSLLPGESRSDYICIAKDSWYYDSEAKFYFTIDWARSSSEIKNIPVKKILSGDTPMQ